MKNFTKLFIVFFLFAVAAESFGQSFGFKAGLNLSKQFAKDNEANYTADLKMKPGFNVGVTAEFPIADFISFETGLIFSTKGYKYSEEDVDFKYKENLNMFYVDVPLTAKATFELGGVSIYGLLGPYVGMGIGGKLKWEDSFLGETTKDSEKINWGSDADNDDFKRLDFGLTFGAGVEISSFQVGLSYGLGLANISSYTEAGTKINNRVIGISVGYKF